MAKRRTEWRGLAIVIENEAGSYREWRRPDGSPGRTQMRFPYGFFSDHAGSDGDELDCYIGPDLAARFVYVVHQLAPDGSRDEDKVFVDFSDEAAAKAAFLAHRDDGDRCYGGMSSIPAEDFIRKLSRRAGDGKIRHSRMDLNQRPLFCSVPAFRFSLGDLATAIGKWSRGATFGYKGAKGQGLDFNAQTLAQMIDNAAARGDRISICADHLSVLGPPQGREAPSLGYFYAMALFQGGQLLKHWAYDGGQPPPGIDEDGQPREGLYCRLGEITPRGMDPLVGLANYSSLSPTFPPPDRATDEAGNPIGYALIDFAATSTPFQAGCELQLHMAATPAATGAARAANQGEQMDPKTLSKLGLAAGATDADVKAAAKRFSADAATKMAALDPAACAEMGTDLESFAGFMDGEDAAAAKALAKKFKKMGAPDVAPPAAMADQPTDEEKKKDEEAMTALAMSLRARNVTVPPNATRAVLMSLAAMAPPQVDDGKLSALVSAEIEKRETAAAKAAETAEREQLVTMARDAKAPEFEIQALGLLPIASAREQAKKYGAAPAAPPHLFGRMSQQGGPIGGPAGSGARDVSVPRGPRVIGKSGDAIATVIMDDEIGDAIEKLADSKDPLLMSKVDALLAPNERGQKWARLVAAGKIVEKEQPHLLDQDRNRQILMGGAGLGIGL